jgi:hypothetical protein
MRAWWALVGERLTTVSFCGSGMGRVFHVGLVLVVRHGWVLYGCVGGGWYSWCGRSRRACILGLNARPNNTY